MTQDFTSAPESAVSKPVSSWTRRIAILGVTVAAIAGAGAYAIAGGPNGFGPGGMRHGMMRAMMEHRVDEILGDAGASPEQKAKIKTILTTAMQAVRPDRKERHELRDKALDLLEAPVIDRAAIEQLRAKQIATMDEKSKIVAKAVADAAEVLNPDQRKKLVDELDELGPGMGMFGPGMGGFRHGDDQPPMPGKDAPAQQP